jgi:hypothetical protein
MFKINCTWSYLNFYYLNELIDWHQQEFSCNRYGDRTDLIFQKAIGTYALNFISQLAFDKIQKKFSQYSDLQALLMSLSIDDTYSHDVFWKEITRLDSVRNKDFKALCSDWVELL